MPPKLAAKKASPPSTAPLGRFQRRAVCDGVGGALGLEPPGALAARLAAADSTAAAIVDDVAVRAEPSVDLCGLGLEALPPSLSMVAAWLQHLDLSGCCLTLGACTCMRAYAGR
jgi:hypothetical protein